MIRILTIIIILLYLKFHLQESKKREMEYVRVMEYMRAKLNTEEGTEQYQKRMFTLKPVFGQMKQDRELGNFF